jgi:hypothetical protein
MAKSRAAKGRYGEDDGKPIDVSALTVAGVKADLDDTYHAGDRVLVVAIVEVQKFEIGPVSESTLARLHKGKALSAVIVDDGPTRERLWKECQAAYDAKSGQQTLDVDGLEESALTDVVDSVDDEVPDTVPDEWEDPEPRAGDDGDE